VCNLNGTIRVEFGNNPHAENIQSVYRPKIDCRFAPFQENTLPTARNSRNDLSCGPALPGKAAVSRLKKNQAAPIQSDMEAPGRRFFNAPDQEKKGPLEV
jgi:hypothetical protein